MRWLQIHLLCVRVQSSLKRLTPTQRIPLVLLSSPQTDSTSSVFDEWATPGSYLLSHTKHRCELLLDAPLPANVPPSEAVLFDPHGGAAASSSEVPTVAGSPKAGCSKRQNHARSLLSGPLPLAKQFRLWKIQWWSPRQSVRRVIDHSLLPPSLPALTLEGPAVVASPKAERTLKRQRTCAPSPKSVNPAVQTNPELQSPSPKGEGGLLSFLQRKRE